MTVLDLNDEVKAALDYFGLTWAQRDLVTIKVEVAKMTFKYEGRSVIVTVL